MKYYIKRDLNEYGPYTLADLQRYVAQGNILMTDLTRSEGLADWVPVSQVVGNIPPPAPAPSTQGTVYGAAPAAAAAYGAAPAYGVTATPALAAGLMPPDLHWALVLVISLFCGFFQLVWLFVEAGFVKKLRPQSDFLVYLIAGHALSFGSVFVFYVLIVASAFSRGGEPPAPGAFVVMFLAVVTAGVLNIMGIFKMRSAIQDYYNTTENIGLRLSGVMTFFFSVFYFQYHFTRIVEWKKTGILQPQ
jgi:hypothetical protein